jgi:hypothetical protein
MTAVSQPPEERAPGSWVPPGDAAGWGPLPSPAVDPRWAPASGSPPAVTPGLVPLRPLGVGEILDGAIGAIRTNPRTMLGLSAVVVVASSLLQFLGLWLLMGDVASAASTVGSDPSVRQLLLAVGDSAALYLATVVVQWLATTVLGGVLAVAVGRGVLGQSPSAGEAWAAVRPVVGRLLGLTVVVGLALLSPVVLVTAVVTLLGAAGAPGAVLLLVGGPLALAVLPLVAWLYVRWALAAPALVLESSGGTRRVGILAAMSRSTALVRGAWWRTFGLLLLVALLAAVVTGVVSAPFQLGSLLIPGSDDDVTVLAVQTAGALAASLLVTPFQAAALTLLYVDRRIRREGLDIELARAAGVQRPARGGGPSGAGGPDW